MNYVERDGIWHIVTRTEDAEAVTVCNLRIVQQTYLWERERVRCAAGARRAERAVAAGRRMRC